MPNLPKRSAGPTAARALVVAGVAALASPPAAWAQESSRLEGRFMFGYRSVSVGGELDKYREDVNLDDGPRLMGLEVTFTPSGELAGLVDRVRVDADDLGGEPFETLRFEARKHGRYAFDYARHESAYVYDDQLLPADEESLRNARAGDFHTFDLRRVRDRASLDVELGERAGVSVGFDRYRRTGRSTRPLSIERDEFELDRPIDEASFESHAAVRYGWDRLTLTLEGRYRDFESTHEAFLPGRSLGGFPDDATTLDSYVLAQPYASTSRTHTLRVVATPLDRLTIRASGSLQSLDLDLEGRESVAGTGFDGTPFASEAVGEGDIERNLEQWELDATYLVGDRWGWVGGLYLRDLEQDGAFDFDEVERRGRRDQTTRGFEAGAQWMPHRGVELTAGLRGETREVEHGAVAGAPIETTASETDHAGFFGTGSWRPRGGTSLTLDYEDGSIDGPFTLASATDRSRLRLAGRHRMESGLWLSGSYQRTRLGNDDSGWKANHDLATVRLGYRADRIEARVGYSRVEVDRRYESLVEGTFGPPALFDVDYGLSSGFVDGLVRWRVAEALWVGGELRRYANDGSFAVSRSDLRAFGEYRFSEGYLVRLGARHTDYDEDAFDFDDYDAWIADVGVGYAW